MTPLRAAVTLPLLAAAVVAAGGGVAAARSSGVVTIRMGEYFYAPKVATVRVGQRVRFVNVGKIEHTVADSTRRGAIVSRLIKPRPLAHGATQTVVFRKPGTVYYLCTFHPTLMRGKIVVRR